MSIMDNLKELMDMSAVQEEDNPVFISRTGEFNLFSPKHKIRKNRKYGDTGVAYSEDGKTLEECPAIRPGRIRIHEGVERIGVNAFRNGRLSAIIMNMAHLCVVMFTMLNSEKIYEKSEMNVLVRVVIFPKSLFRIPWKRLESLHFHHA